MCNKDRFGGMYRTNNNYLFQRSIKGNIWNEKWKKQVLCRFTCSSFEDDKGVEISKGSSSNMTKSLNEDNHEQNDKQICCDDKQKTISSISSEKSNDTNKNICTISSKPYDDNFKNLSKISNFDMKELRKYEKIIKKKKYIQFCYVEV